MIGFCEHESALRDTISGFRRGHSTTMVLMGIRDDLIRAMKKGKVTLMVMADFSKAFDTSSNRTAVVSEIHATSTRQGMTPRIAWI